MTKSQRAALVAKRLAELYPQPAIPLQHRDPYTLLIAVLLSAQCTDLRVNKVTPELFAAADNPQRMVQVGQEKVYELIRSCGLAPQKSRAIVALSEILVDRYDSTVPADIEALEQLPGVGHKTASVVMCQAFGQPAFPVDTHIHRLARRWRLSSGRNVTVTERDLKRLFAKSEWALLHLRMIYYGREYCSARGCDGSSCPICSLLSDPKKNA